MRAKVSVSLLYVNNRPILNFSRYCYSVGFFSRLLFLLFPCITQDLKREVFTKQATVRHNHFNCKFHLLILNNRPACSVISGSFSLLVSVLLPFDCIIQDLKREAFIKRATVRHIHLNCKSHLLVFLCWFALLVCCPCCFPALHRTSRQKPFSSKLH